jgi:hypothetical protein
MNQNTSYSTERQWGFPVFYISRMPWVIRVYLILLSGIAILTILSAWQIPSTVEPNAEFPLKTLFNFSVDLMKIVVGALLGSLSIAASYFWGTPKNDKKSSEKSADPEVKF